MILSVCLFICMFVCFPLPDILGIGDEIPTYEQVYRVDPDPSLCRPIILIGAPGVGRRTLIRKLLNSDPSLYQPVVQREYSRGGRGELYTYWGGYSKDYSETLDIPKENKPPNKGQAESTRVYTLYRKSPLKEDNLSTKDKTAGPKGVL